MTLEDLIAEIEATPAALPPSTAEIRLRGAMQGGSAGFADEAAGGVAALASTAQTPWRRTPGPLALARLYPGVPYAQAAARWFEENRPDVQAATAAEKGRQAAPAAYAAERDKQRAGNERARAASKWDYLGGQVVGGLVPAAFSAGAGIPGALAYGAEQGLGYSDASSARGLAGDTALGAAVGLGGYGVGSALGKVASGAASFAQTRLARALARETARAAETKAAAVQSAAGSLGGARAEANRVVEAIRGLLSEPNLSDPQRAALEALKGTPEYAAAVQTLAASLEKRLPEVASKVATAETGLATAQGGKTVTEMVAEGVSPKTAWTRGIKPRLVRYGLPTLGSVIGGAVGGVPGATIGAFTGAGMRPSVRAMLRGVMDPAVQTAIWSPVRSAAQAGASEGGRLLTQSLARAGIAAGTPSAAGLADYLRKSAEDRAAEAELERLLRE